VTYFTYYSNPANAGQFVWAPLFKAEGLNWFGHGLALPGLQGADQDNFFSTSISGFIWQFGIAAGIALIGLCGVALWRAERMRRGIQDSAGRMLALCFCVILFTDAVSITIWGIGLIPGGGTDMLPVLSLQFPMSLFQGILIGILISLFRTKDNYAREQAKEIIAG
jgi:cell division protein FtsW (lipid II flippase)